MLVNEVEECSGYFGFYIHGEGWVEPCYFSTSFSAVRVFVVVVAVVAVVAVVVVVVVGAVVAIATASAAVVVVVVAAAVTVADAAVGASVDAIVVVTAALVAVGVVGFALVRGLGWGDILNGFCKTTFRQRFVVLSCCIVEYCLVG